MGSMKEVFNSLFLKELLKGMSVNAFQTLSSLHLH